MAIDTQQFRHALDKMIETNSRKKKRGYIQKMYDQTAAISFLSGKEFQSAGVGKKTVLSVAQDVFGESIDGSPTVSQSLERFDEDSSLTPMSLEILRSDMQEVASLSGNEMEEQLAAMFKSYDYPSLVSFACLNDLPTGVGDTTIANALGVRDSLPFYNGVHEIAGKYNPRDSPELGLAFSPMLAKSEKNLPEDLDGWWGQPKLDGYRVLIHLYDRPESAGGGQEVRAFSRQMNEITESLPELDEIDWPAGEFIFDAEVIAETGSYSDTSKRIGRDEESVELDVGMNFGIFDMVIYGGQDISDQSFRSRFGKIQSALLSVSDDRVHVLGVFQNPDKARRVAKPYEGLIWKNPDSDYAFGERSDAWVKEKHTDESIDCVAVGFEEGEGRLDGTLGKIALESADGVSLGETGSGLTDSMRDTVWENRDAYLGEPLEVRAEAFDEGLRFPIFKRWRSDDGEADSIERVRSVLPTV
jgi:ATP-dependent DNA ligase